MRDYKIFKLADEPKYFGISIIAAIPATLLISIGLIIGQGPYFLLAGGLIGGFMHFKFGIRGIRYFYSVLYWSLPRFMTRMILPNSPDSAIRQYRG